MIRVIIISLFMLIAFSCGNKKFESRPFQYNESGTMYSGAFAISSDYFAELILNIETGKLTVIINGQETPFELSIEGNLKEIFEPMLCISTGDVNEDGYVDFTLTPYCSSTHPDSYVYVFNKDKKQFEKLISSTEEYDESEFPLIGKTIGFITLSRPEQSTLDPSDSLNKITFINDDGSNWLSLPINLGDYSSYVEQGLFEYNKEFRPWAFESGIETFAIRCIGQTDSTYTVVVNEEEDLVKRLRKHKNLHFETTEKHVSNVLIGTDFNKNPLREAPNDNAPIIGTTAEEIDLIRSVDVKNDWIKLEDLNTSKPLGWIRWKKGNRFMIEIYYSI